MSREIKFRAWDTANDRMVDEPYKFHPINEYQKNTYQWTGDHVFYENWQDVDDGIDRPCFLMQFTGLKDKKGVEIYEGDIVESETSWRDSIVRGQVIWVNDLAMWKVEEIHPEYSEREYLCELVAPKHPNRSVIIGNIYQNPELLTPQTI